MSNLHQFNPGRKSWKMYANTITSISGDDLTISPYDGKDLILEVSGNNEIIFKKGDTSYNLADLSNIASSDGSGIQNGDDVSFQNVDISGTLTIDSSNIIINNKNITITDSTITGYSQLGSDILGENRGDYAGRGLALSYDGTRLAIGSARNQGPTSSGGYVGHVRVLDWNGSLWSQVGADIDNPDQTSTNGSFGGKLRISNDGNIIAIAENSWDNTSNSSDDYRKGRVYVYELSNNSWIQMGNTLEGDNIGDFFGRGLGLSNNGTRLFVGADLADASGSDSGSVKIYDWDGSAWQLNATIHGTSNDDNIGFDLDNNGNGNSVAIYSGGSNHIKIYDYNGSSWSQRGSAITDPQTGNNKFGRSLALSNDGNRVITSAWTADNSGNNSGSIYTFDWNGSTWSQVGNKIDGLEANDNFGKSIDASDDGNRLIASSISNNSNTGYVRVFYYENNVWSQISSTIFGSNTDDQTGNDIVFSGNGEKFAFGAILFDEVGDSTGNIGLTRAYEITSILPSLKFDGSNVAIKDDVDASFALYTLTSDLYTKSQLESGNLDLSFQNVDISGNLNVSGNFNCVNTSTSYTCNSTISNISTLSVTGVTSLLNNQVKFESGKSTFNNNNIVLDGASLITSLDGTVDISGELKIDGSNVAIKYEVDASLNSLTSSLVITDTSVNSLTSSLAITDASVNTLMSSLAITDASVNSLTSSLAITDSSVNSLTSSLAITDTSVNNLTTSLAITDTSVNSLTSSLAITDSSVNSLTSSLAITDTSVNNLTTSLAITDTSVNNLTTSLAITDSSVNSLTSSLAITDSSVNSLTSSLAITDSSVNSLTSSLAITDASVNNLTTSLAITDTSVNNLTSSLTTLENNIDNSFALYSLTSNLYNKADLESGNLDLSFQNVDISGTLKVSGLLDMSANINMNYNKIIFSASDNTILPPDSGIIQKVQDLSNTITNNLINNYLDASFGNVDFSGHIIPTIDASFDIGSADRQIRHLYVSNNTIYFGDITTLGVDNSGNFKLRKRKQEIIPSGLFTGLLSTINNTSDLLTNINSTLSTSFSSLKQVKLNKWKKYSDIKRSAENKRTIAIDEIFQPSHDNDWEEIKQVNSLLEEENDASFGNVDISGYLKIDGSNVAIKDDVDASLNSLLTQINSKAYDADVVKLSNTQTISGIKTFSNDVTISRTSGDNSEFIMGPYTQPQFIRNSGQGDGRYFNCRNGIGGTIRMSMGIIDSETDVYWKNHYANWYIKLTNTKRLVPSINNACDVGSSSTRWDDIYATNGSINTSDRTLKQQITPLSATELSAATTLSKLFRTYKLNDAVDIKGEDARIHTGVIAQDVERVLNEHGLDALRYAIICKGTYYERTDELDGESHITRVETSGRDAKPLPEGAVEHTYYGLRYIELLNFIAAATEQRLASTEQRLVALETTISNNFT